MSNDSNYNKVIIQEKECISIVEQLEYYFSDSNLLNDKFMNKQVQQSKDGWISIHTLLTFNKLHTLLEQSLSTNQKEKSDDSMIVDSKVSTIITTYTAKDVLQSVLSSDQFRSSKLIESNQQLVSIRRIVPFIASDDLIRSIDEKTIYIEPIPDIITNEQLLDQLKSLGEIEKVSIPRFPDRKSKGFAFIEFKKKDDSVNAINIIKQDIENKFKWRVLSKLEWLEKKKQIVDAYKNEYNHHHNHNHHEHDEFTTHHDGIDKRLLKVEGIPIETNKPFLWKQLDKYFHSIFLDYYKGGINAILRFKTTQERDDAQAMVKNGKVIVDGQTLTTSALTDHEFKTHMNRSTRFQHQKQQIYENEQRMKQQDEGHQDLKRQQNRDKKKRKKEKQKEKKNNNNSNDNNSIVNFDSDDENSKNNNNNNNNESKEDVTMNDDNYHKRSFSETKGDSKEDENENTNKYIKV